MVDSAALDDAEFLIRSTHRIQLLEAIADEPRSRSELQELTGVARVTLGRSLGDMEDRNWIERVDHDYEIRPLGELTLDGISDCLDALETQRRLQSIMHLMPTESFDFDLRHLHDAEITLADRTDTTAPARRYATLMAEATRIRKCSFAVDPSVANAFWEQTTQPEQDIEAVLTPGALETALEIQEEQTLEEFDDPKRALLEYETVYVHEEMVPYNMLITDRIVAFLLSERQGTLPAMIECENETIRRWAEDTFESYRRTATPVEID